MVNKDVYIFTGKSIISFFQNSANQVRVTVRGNK